MTKREKEVKANRKRRACVRLDKALPTILERIDRQLAYKTLSRRKASALAVLLMQRLMIRVGNEKSAEERQTYGITTLLPEHVTITGDTVQFSFIGKANVPWHRTITDPRVAAILSELKNGAEKQLFWYWDNGTKTDLTDTDVRDWLKSSRINPKDFRTHKANILLHDELVKRATTGGLSKSAARKQVSAAFETVAEHLGHLPATCRANYVFPELWKNYVENRGTLTVSPFGR